MQCKRKKQSKERKIRKYKRQEIEQKNMQTNYKLKTFLLALAVHLYQTHHSRDSLLRSY